jgi:hypothetical protein
MLEKGVGEISDAGMSRWFINNLPFNLDAQYKKLTGKPYPHVGTSCEKNIGFRGVYDPEHGRYILTKKDYRIVDEIYETITLDPGAGNYVIGEYYVNDDGFWRAASDSVLGIFDFIDKDLAENKCWTISFSTGIKSWVSFHSYLPSWMYSNAKTFYSYMFSTDFGITGQMWEHNFGDYQNYYGIKFDWIIDYIYKKDGYQEITNDTVEYTSNVYVESTTNKEWINVPFITIDRLITYNNDQISNMKTIIPGNLSPYSELNYDNTEAIAHKMRNFWRISKLRDQAVGRLTSTEPLFSSNWLEADYSDYFYQSPGGVSNVGYIDKVINPAAIDEDKSVYEMQRFTDKYFGVRMFFKPEENYKIILNIMSGLKRTKI